MLLAEKARDGHIVARLKWGDAFVFDSGAKEALFLHEQGVPFEVVPGIPAAIGATAYAGMPAHLSGRAATRSCCCAATKAETRRVARRRLGRARALDGTIVCYAGGRLVPSILQPLLDHGAPPDDAGRADLPRHAAGAADGHRHDRRAARTRRRRTPRGEAAMLVVGDVDRACAITCGGSTSGRSSAGASSSRDRGSRRASSSTRSRISARRRSRRRRSGSRRPRIRKRSIARRRRSTATTGSSSNRRTRSRGFSRRSRAGRAICARSAACRSARSAPSTADRLARPRPQGRRRRRRSSASRASATRIGAQGPARRSARAHRPARSPARRRSPTTWRDAARSSPISSRTAPRPNPRTRRPPGPLPACCSTARSTPSRSRVRRRCSRFASLIGEEQAADLLNTTVVAAIGPVTAAAAAELGIRTTRRCRDDVHRRGTGLAGARRSLQLTRDAALARPDVSRDLQLAAEIRR